MVIVTMRFVLLEEARKKVRKKCQKREYDKNALIYFNKALLNII